jgi:hypothetical protein
MPQLSFRQAQAEWKSLENRYRHRFQKSKLKGLDLSKRRENEIGKEWRGREAVYEAEGAGSRQWRVDSGSGASAVTRADRQLRC